MKALREACWLRKQTGTMGRTCEKGPCSTAPCWEHVRGLHSFSFLCNPVAKHWILKSPLPVGKPHLIPFNIV